jgi:Uma2 family endonuclease
VPNPKLQSRGIFKPMFDLSEIEPTELRPLLRSAYEKLGALGYFGDERVELLGGWVVKMSPMGSLHRRFEALLVRFFAKALPPELALLPQCSFPLSEISEPEPDLAVITDAELRDEGPYSARLMIEIADSSLAKDRGVKAKLYAAAGVPDYWVIDVNACSIEVHRDPEGDHYRTITRHDRFAKVQPLLLPDIVVCLDDLLK